MWRPLVGFCLISMVLSSAEKVKVKTVKYLHSDFKSIKKFEIFPEQLLGRGTTGPVVAGKIDGRDVAVKIAAWTPEWVKPFRKINKVFVILKKIQEKTKKQDKKELIKMLFHGLVKIDTELPFKALGLHINKDKTFLVLAMTKVGINVWDACSMDNIDIKKKPTCTPLDGLLMVKDLLRQMEVVHSAGIAYGDSKPRNYALSLDGEKVVLVDFERSKKFTDEPVVRSHVGGKPLVSCPNSHSVTLSRRDDVLELVQTVVYILNGKMPWKDLDDESVLKLKQELPAAVVAKGLPAVFSVLFEKARKDAKEYAAEVDYKSYNDIVEAAIQEIAGEEAARYSWLGKSSSDNTEQ